MRESTGNKKKNKLPWFWISAIGSFIMRLILIFFPKHLNLSSRPEVSTPLTSLLSLAEGYWLKHSSMSSYVVIPLLGSMHHGSPLLWTLLCPLTVTRIEGQPDHLLCRFFLREILLLLYSYGILSQYLHALVYPHLQLRT